ncbi:MAG: hypothetical protein ACMUHM_09110 [Thermoplasmatota archaeon]
MENIAERISLTMMTVGIVMVCAMIPFIIYHDLIKDPWEVTDPRTNEHHEFVLSNSTSNVTFEAHKGEYYIFAVNRSYPESFILISENNTIYDSQGKRYSNETDTYRGEKFTYRGWFEQDGTANITMSVNGTCHLIVVKGSIRDYWWVWERWYIYVMGAGLAICMAGLPFLSYAKRDFTKWKKRERREKWKKLRSEKWTKKQKIGLVMLIFGPIIGISLMVIQFILLGGIFEIITIAIIVIPAVVGWSFISGPTEKKKDESIIYYHCNKCELINEVGNRERPFTVKCKKCGAPLLVPDDWKDLPKDRRSPIVYACPLCKRTLVLYFYSKLEFRCPNCTMELIMDRKYPGKNPVMKMKGYDMIEK